MNITHTVTTEQIFRIEDSEKPGVRFADIHYVDGKFQKCEFRLSAPIYTLEDWEFLNLLSHKIIQIATR